MESIMFRIMNLKELHQLEEEIEQIEDAQEREAIITEWDKQVDSLVSAEAKLAEKHYTNQFRWHLFSFELLPNEWHVTNVLEDVCNMLFLDINYNSLYSKI